MSYNYKKAYVPANGYTPVCKIGECSLKKLEFGIIELDAGESVDFNSLKSVVLPQPDGPITAITSPLFTSKSTPLRTSNF